MQRAERKFLEEIDFSDIPENFIDTFDKKVEIQVRTIAMDFWASLEHQLRYKAEANIPESTRERLKKSAESVYALDTEMQKIYREIEMLESIYAIGHKTT